MKIKSLGSNGSFNLIFASALLGVKQFLIKYFLGKYSSHNLITSKAATYCTFL